MNDNTLTVYIRRLRQKLDDGNGQQIETVRGGFRIGEIVMERTITGVL